MPKILGKRNYIARYRPMSFLSVVKTHELPLSHRDRITSRRLHRGRKESGTVVPHAGMKYFRKPLVKLDVVKARIFAL